MIEHLKKLLKYGADPPRLFDFAHITDAVVRSNYLFDNDGRCYDGDKMSQVQSTNWESLIPTSYKLTAYIPSLKTSVTAGSFVRYYTGIEGDKDHESHTSTCRVGRILEVVASLDMVPNGERHQLMNVAAPLPANIEIPIQYVKMNHFQDRRSLSECNFPSSLEDNQNAGWQSIVQTDILSWMPSNLIEGLAFIAFADDHDAFDDCKGMCHFYFAKYRIESGTGVVSLIPKHMCPPFAGQIDDFCTLWSVDFCQMAFHTIRHIRQEMQKILCRVAQSQGDFAAKNVKVYLPSCAWCFIKDSMASKGVHSLATVKFSRPRVSLSWGLSYCSHRQTGYLDILRFDTDKKMEVFRSLFGAMAGFGVRKKRPRYSDGRFPLSINDVINVVVCRCSAEQQGNGNTSTFLNDETFQRFGVTEDGIDLSYDANESTLQISLRYRKLVVTRDSLHLLESVGVVASSGATKEPGHDADEPGDGALIHQIIPGMEFIDGDYILRIHEIRGSVIHAKRWYKIVDTTGRTVRVHALEVMIYRDIEAVHRMIQARDE